MEYQQTDALIIGFGKGGKTLAPFLAKQGWSVTVVEQDAAMYGGTCINIGCIPTKSLVHSAENAAARDYADFANKEKAFEEAWRTKEELVAFLRSKNQGNIENQPGMQLITGHASFLSPHEVLVEISGRESVTVSAKHIFVNTGAIPFMPAIEGADASKRVYNSTTLLGLNKLPRRMAIIGSGFISLEFASMYANFGTEITILERGPEILKREDQDVREEIINVLKAKGIRFQLSTRVTGIKDNGDETVVTVMNGEGQVEQLEVDAVLIAAGRKPNTDSLALDRAGVAVTDKGFIAVDDTLRTNVPHIWAIGDVNGGPQFTYISLDDYRIIKNQLFGDGSRTRNHRKNIPHSVFITPVFARVGLSEEEALKAGYRIKVAKLPGAASVRARILKNTDGMFKAVINAANGHILGCTLFCVDAGELINLIALAMDNNQPYTYLRDRIYTHPSMTEIFNELFAQID